MGVLSTVGSNVLLEFRNQRQKRAIVFIHGLYGDAKLSWGQFPDLLISNDSLSDWDVFSFGFRSSPLLFTSFEGLGELLYTQVSHSSLAEYEELALITHGEGGLIVQLALLNHEDLARRVTQAFFFGSPNAGLHFPYQWFLELALRLLRLADVLVPFLKFSFEPVFKLMPGSAFLADLNQRWKDAFNSGAPFQYWAIAADEDQLVSVESLTTFPANSRLVVPGDHFTISRPESPDALVVQIVLGTLSNRKVPEKPQRAAEGTIALQTKLESGDFDVFLAFDAPDRVAVRAISEKLKQRGIRPWLDEDRIKPGMEWESRLMEDFDRIRSVAVFLGKSGPTRFRSKEQTALLDEFVNRNLPGDSGVPSGLSAGK